MKISLAPQQYFDLDGKPLVAGRLKIHLHGSDTLADTFILSGNDFVEGPNPVILDNAGEQQNTIFMEAAIYDIEVEKLDNGQYAKISDFQFGFIMPSAKNDTIVEGIAGLEQADPELGFVSVVGYDGTTYAGQRTYMWDSQCTEEADGGCIIASDVSDRGRWLLLSDLRELPCTYYGIEAGRESNISAFLTYLPVVGTYGIFMPPVPRFVQGTYTTEGIITSLKTISFDQGAKFTKLKFSCIAAEISEPVNDYVADFLFLHQAYAESSWFRTVKSFWSCGAAELHQSRTNHFENTNLGNGATGVAYCKITGSPITMTGTGNLLITHCDIADRALSTNWYCIFQDMVLTDRWFADSNWNIGQSTSYRQYANTGATNVLDIANFANANVYVLWAAAWGLTALNLRNRDIGTIDTSMPFLAIANGSINEAHFDNNITLSNVICPNLNFENSNIAVITKDCNATVNTASCKTWQDKDSSFAFSCDIDVYYTELSWNGTDANLNSHRIGRADDDLIAQKPLTLWGCTINNGVIAHSEPVVLESNIANTVVYVYPYSFFDGSSMTWRLGCEFRKNRFNGASAINIGANNGLSDHLTEVYECAVSGIAITDNVFNTTVFGVNCPFWSGPNMSHRFIRGMTTYDCTDPTAPGDYFPTMYEYARNSNNCPKAYARPTGVGNGGLVSVTGWASVAGSTYNDLSFQNNVAAEYVFALPALANASREAIPDPTHSTLYYVDNRCVTVPYRAKATVCEDQVRNCIDYPQHCYMPICAYDKSMPNSMFYCIPGTYNYISQLCGVNPINAEQ